MSPELVFVLWCVISFEDLSKEYYVENSGTISEFNSASNPTNQDRLYHGFGKKTQLVLAGDTYTSMASVPRAFKIYYEDVASIDSARIISYISMTNFWLNLLRIGHTIEISDVEGKSAEELLAIETGFNDGSIVEDLILFTTSDISGTSSDLPIGYNTPYSDRNCIVVSLLPANWMAGNSYVFDPRVLAHEFLHNSHDHIYHSLDCKSIMSQSLNPNMGWSNIDIIMGYNEESAGEVFGYSQFIDNYIYPKPTNDFCWTQETEMDELAFFEKGIQIKSKKKLESIAAILNNRKTFYSPVVKQIVANQEKMKFKENGGMSPKLFIQMIIESEKYYKSFLEFRSLSAIIKYYERTGIIDRSLQLLQNSYHKKIIRKKFSNK